MEKNQEIILQESLNDEELLETKNFKKLKYSIAMIASTLIFSAVITLSFMSLKKEVIEKETKPVVRNLGFSVSSSKTYHLGSFGIKDQTFVFKYVVSMSSTNCQNKIVISSSSGSWEFGNIGMSSPGKGSKSYSYKILKSKYHLSAYRTKGSDYFLIGKVNGTLSWNVGLKSGSGANAKYSVELTGALNFHPECKTKENDSGSFCSNKGGILVNAKGKLILSNKNVTEDSDFSLKMGNLKFRIRVFSGCIFRNVDFLNYYGGWCSSQ